MILDSNTGGKDGSASNTDEVGLPPGDIGIDLFVPKNEVAKNGENIVSCYAVVITNPAQ